MSAQSLHESCSCGASFDMSGDYFPYLDQSVREWRTAHRHEQPVRVPDVDFPPVPQGSLAQVERAEQFDHDTRSPVGFATGAS